MSLFNQLLQLQVKSSGQPVEDYLTELIAYAFAQHPTLLADFMAHFTKKNSALRGEYIRTQATYRKLKHHKKDSIIDLTITSENHQIFIENKIDSGEGERQLARYAEHLDLQNGRKTLIYITLHHDPKEQSKICKDCANEINFVQLRWHEVGSFLRHYNDHLIIKEIILFMETKGLTTTNRFTPTDILALTNFERVRRTMLDLTMQGEVEKKFVEITGGKTQHAAWLTQIRDHDRYMNYQQHQGNKAYYGYWLNNMNNESYPQLGVMLEVSPNSAKRKNIISIYQRIIATKSKWSAANLDRSDSWAQLYIKCSLNDFLTEDNQIKSIQAYFLNCLEELESIFPQLQDIQHQIE